MQRRAAHPSRRALTLLEVLIALGLIVALLSSMFVFLFSMFDTRQRARDFSAQQRSATTLIDRLETDLMSCITADARAGAGVVGNETSIVVLSRGVPVHLAGRGVSDSAVLADLARTSYSFDAAAQQLSVSRHVIGDRGMASAEVGRSHALEGALGKVQLRYHDGSRWRDSFDSLSAGRLPNAIEVAIWFDPPPSAESVLLHETDEESGATVEPLERMTFDPGANFDEDAYAAISDMELSQEPPPDRLRVIIIPDALGEEDEDNEAYFAQPVEEDAGEGGGR
jgi:type II secretory pathway pseudopilin PulG